MPIYNYKARDYQGKRVRGTVEAANTREAVSLIRERQLFLTNLAEQRKSPVSLSFAKLQKISFSDIVNFTRQLSPMTTAGLQIQEALLLLKTQANNPAMSEMLTKISREIQAGGNMATSLGKFPRQFSKTYLALIKAGESSGKLDRVMERLADNLEKDLEFKNKVKNAMIYPVIIMMAMVAVFILLMVVVVPKLTEIYVDFGADLPLATRILQGISDLMVKFWWMMLGIGIIGLKIFQKWRQTDLGKRSWDGLTLRLPLLGQLQKQIILVDFTRTLSMLIGAGVHILDALNILVESMDNIHFQLALKEITKKVEKGFALGVLFSQFEVFPVILSQMVKVGEETGKLDESLLKVSVYFERESDYTVKGLTTAIEPIIMIVLGIGVAFIVFAIITPIYKLTTQF